MADVRVIHNNGVHAVLGGTTTPRPISWRSSPTRPSKYRAFPYAPVIVSQWLDPAKSEENIRWARAFWTALHAFSGGGVYVNDLGHDDEDRVRLAYGANYERLVALKRKYDPDNVFRLNPNIKPVPTPGVG